LNKEIEIQFNQPGDPQVRVTREWLDEQGEVGQLLLQNHCDVHPLCLCRKPGVPMYIGKRQSYYLARMPNSGSKHASYCPSYAPDREQTGQSIYETAVIKENSNGSLSVRLGVSIKPGKTPEAKTEEPQEDDKEEPKETNNHSKSSSSYKERMSLHGLLTLLWEQAGFNRWSPAMEHKRNWYVLRKYLQLAAQQIVISRRVLGKHLYIPESFNYDNRDEINARQKKEINNLLQKAGDRALFLGFLREVHHQPDFGTHLVLKHAGMDHKLWLTKKAESQFTKLGIDTMYIQFPRGTVVLALVTRPEKNSALQVMELAAITVNDQSLPIQDETDELLAKHLVEEKRLCVRQMRYEPGGALTGVPGWLLLDAGPDPLPLEIHRACMSAEYSAAWRIRQDRLKEHYSDIWVWDQEKTGKTIPALPNKAWKTQTQ